MEGKTVELRVKAKNSAGAGQPSIPISVKPSKALGKLRSICAELTFDYNGSLPHTLDIIRF